MGESPDLHGLILRLIEAEGHPSERTPLQGMPLVAGDRDDHVRLRALHQTQGVGHRHRIATLPPAAAALARRAVVESQQDLRGSFPDRIGEVMLLEHRGQRADRPVVLQMSQRPQGFVSRRRGR